MPQPHAATTRAKVTSAENPTSELAKLSPPETCRPTAARIFAKETKLTEDEAFVIRMTMGSAGYAIVPATNYWGGIGDFLNHRTTLSFEK